MRNNWQNIFIGALKTKIHMYSIDCFINVSLQLCMIFIDFRINNKTIKFSTA